MYPGITDTLHGKRNAEHVSSRASQVRLPRLREVPISQATLHKSSAPRSLTANHSSSALLLDWQPSVKELYGLRQ